MAIQRWRFDLEWENNNTFEMTEKLDDGDSVSVIKIEENAELINLWNHIESICKATFDAKLQQIGEDMKA